MPWGREADRRAIATLASERLAGSVAREGIESGRTGTLSTLGELGEGLDEVSDDGANERWRVVLHERSRDAASGPHVDGVEDDLVEDRENAPSGRELRHAIREPTRVARHEVEGENRISIREEARLTHDPDGRLVGQAESLDRLGDGEEDPGSVLGPCLEPVEVLLDVGAVQLDHLPDFVEHLVEALDVMRLEFTRGHARLLSCTIS